MSGLITRLVLLISSLQTQPATQPQLIVTRWDAAAALLSFEHAWHEHRPTDAEHLLAANREFDRIAGPFELRKYSQVVHSLHELTDSIAPDAPDTPHSPQARMARAMRVRLSPYVAEPKPALMRIKISPLYPLDINQPATLRFRIIRDEPGEQPLVDREIVVAPSGLTPVLMFQQPAAAPLGRYRLELVAPDGFIARCGSWFVANSSLELFRDENARRLSLIRAGSEKLNQALRGVVARNALLAHQHSETESIEMLVDPPELSTTLAKEVDDVDHDRDPFVDRPGDYWRTITLGTMQVPTRIYAPAAAVDGKQLPLVIALHGAGADENMFMEAYGLGEIKRQADRHGFLVVSPRTDFAMIVPDPVEQILRAVAHDYLIDRSRVYVIGHALGAITAQRWAEQYGPQLAAVCQIAGAAPFSTSVRLPPTLVINGEQDPIFPADRVRPLVESARRERQPVEIRLMPNYGHTLLVGDVLPDAIDWLLKHPAKPAATTTPASGQ